MKQTTALDILKTGENVFLTGSAGSGKTYTLNQYIHYLRARKVAVATTASTGIAATHMNGITIHSWSGIGIKDELSDHDLANLARKQVLKDRIKETSVLIIDEISMLHAKQLNLVDQVLKHIRNSNKPFGGIQVVVAGDFFQLPPVGSRGETNRDKFAFMSEAWLHAQFKICYLSEQHRQQADNSKDNKRLSLDSILNQIRAQEVSTEAIVALQNTFNQDIDMSRTRLYTHNVNVNKINEKELAQLQGEAATYNAIAFGDAKLVENLKKTVRTSEALTLKVGAKVMFIKNNNELSVSNGTMGELIGFVAIKPSKSTLKNGKIHSNRSDDLDDADGLDDLGKFEETDSFEDADVDFPSKEAASPIKYPIVKLNTGRQIVVEPEEWVIEDEHGDVLASYSQIPLGLAWAITIHKSQGMTLDAAEIDLSKTFELGQGYVALSRLKSLEGLKLLGMNDLSLRLDPLARGADIRFKELSQDAEASFIEAKKDDLTELHNIFVLKSGGNLSKSSIKAYESQHKNRLKKQAKSLAQKDKLTNQLSDHSESTLMATRILLEESLSIAEIAQSRGLAQSTIMGHISKLKRQDPTLNCEHLRPDEQIIKRVCNAVNAIIAVGDPNDFRSSDEEHEQAATATTQQFNKDRIKLRPIYDYLKEEIDYNIIRLALIFME